MKKQFSSGIVALMLLFLIPSCNQEQEEASVFEPVLVKTTLAEEGSLATSLSDFTSLELNGRTETATTEFGTLDFNNIIKRIVSEDQPRPNYTILLTPPDSVNFSLEYLVLIGEEEGFRGYILQYQTDFQNILTLQNRAGFTGHTRLLDFNRNIMADNLIENGQDLGSYTNGRTETLYTNCECSYDNEATGPVTGGTINTGYGSTITCVCDAPSEFQGEPGGGGGDGGFPPGGPIGFPGGGGIGGGGSTSGGGNPSGEPGGITPDDIGTKPPCDFADIYGNCLSREVLLQSFEDNFELEYGNQELLSPCYTRAKQRAKDLLDGDIEFAFMFAYGGFMEFLLCETEEGNVNPEKEFQFGFLNAMIAEFDVSQLKDLKKALDDANDTRMECLLRNTGFLTPETSSNTMFNTLMRCTFGLDIEEGDMTIAQQLIRDYVNEIYTDPYERGQAAQFIISAFVPLKVSKVAKLQALLSKVRKLPRHARLVAFLEDIQSKANGSINKLRDLVGIHKLRDAIYRTQKKAVDDYRDFINYQSSKKKGNWSEMGVNVDVTEHGYETLNTRITNIDDGGHHGIDIAAKKGDNYYVIEVKYEGNGLNPAKPETNLPRQMSDAWIRRDLLNAFGDTVGRELTRTKNYTRVVANIYPDGRIIYRLVDSNGYKMNGINGIFTP